MLLFKQGDKVAICGRYYVVLKVVQYKLRTASWINLVCGEAGKELAFELEADEDGVKVWRQLASSEFPDQLVFGDDAIEFRGEQLEEEERGKPKATVRFGPSQVRETKVPYMIYTKEESKVTVCVEDWGSEGLKAFLLEDEIPLGEFIIVK